MCVCVCVRACMCWWGVVGGEWGGGGGAHVHVLCNAQEQQQRNACSQYNPVAPPSPPLPAHTRTHQTNFLTSRPHLPTCRPTLTPSLAGVTTPSSHLQVNAHAVAGGRDDQHVARVHEHGVCPRLLQVQRQQLRRPQLAVAHHKVGERVGRHAGCEGWW